MVNTYDAVVIGSGINGLTAAAHLARSGWSVALVEANSRLGGFIDSAERTAPGFIHDTFSSWHPLFHVGAAYRELGADLAAHGLAYANSDGVVTASVGRDQRVSLAYRDPQRTSAELSEPEDRRSYLAMLEEFDRLGDVIGRVLGQEISLPLIARSGLTSWRRLRTQGVDALARDLASSGNAYLERHFRGWEVDRTWAPWLLHAALGPESATGGLMVPVFAATLHGVGMPIVRGGSSQFIAAFEKVLASAGVDIYLEHRVDAIQVRAGRAVGVTAAGSEFAAKRAVLAGVTPTALYGSLLPDAAVPTAVQNAARTYRYGRGAMQIHLALSSPLKWNDPRLGESPLVHITEGGRAMAISTAQASAGYLPARPTVVVGQQSILDPTRAPMNAATLWIQLQEVPYAPTGDAAGEIDVAGGWTKELKRVYADRVLDIISEHAPGLRSSIIGVDILSPVDLARENINAVNGDPYAGSGELDQNLLWRPFPQVSKHATTVKNLWHIGAATHPGPGLGGGSGYLVSHHLTRKK